MNPGAGNRNYWTGGVAITRQFNKRLLLGMEADREGTHTIDGRPTSSVGFGAIYRLKGLFRLLASGGPTFEDHSGAAGFHAFFALGLDF